LGLWVVGFVLFFFGVLLYYTIFINTYYSRLTNAVGCGNIRAKSQKQTTLTIIALVTLSIALTATTLAAINVNITVPSSGTITAINLGVYSDSTCTIPATSLNIGTLNPGSTATQTVYVKNTGNAPATLTMTTNNWNPTNTNTYLTLTWNRENTVLNAGASIQATMTLTAAANTGTLTTFSCDVTLTGTQ